MARLVKEWMKAKKGICSSDCECLTITWWRCYAEEHLCNCGDWGSTPPVPPVPPVPTEIPLESIGEPSTDNVTLTMWDSGAQVSFNFLPTDANTLNRDVQVVSTDDNIASPGLASWWADWVAYIEILPTWEGNATVTYSFGGTSYDIAVTVNALP